MACVIEKNVLRFQVAIRHVSWVPNSNETDDAPVYDIEPMQMLQSAEKLRGVKSAPVLVELAFTLQVIE